MRYAMIMAGGSGTRLWPMSRKLAPKQLLPFIQGRSLLQIAGEDIRTDLSPLEITRLLSAMAHTKLSTRRLPGREYWENDLSYWMPATNLHHPSGNGEPPQF